MMKSFPTVALVALGLSASVSAQTQTKKPVPAPAPKPIQTPTGVIAQDQNGGYTLRVLKAKWATLQEVSLWPRPDRALTLWVDVVSPQPFSPTREEKEANLTSLASRLIDGEQEVNGGFSQLISVGSDRYGRELPYVPGDSPEGQMIWRVPGVDPRTQEVVLSWELLVPGASPVKANWPPALLTKEKAALQVSKNAQAETRRFTLRLPLKQVEASKVAATSITPPKVVEKDGRSWKIWMAPASKTKIRVSSRMGGGKSPEIELWRVKVPVVVTGDTAGKAWNFNLRDAAGNEWPAGSSAQYDRSAINYWRPDGKLLAANEQTFELPVQFASQLKPDNQWTLEGRREGKTEQIASQEFKAVTVPQTLEAALPAAGTWKIRELRRFSEAEPLTAGWAPTGQKSGVALKLALSVPNADTWTRAFLRDLKLSDGTVLYPAEDALMVVAREAAQGDKPATIVFQGILPPVENANTLEFKVDGGFSREADAKIVIPGLSFSAAENKQG